MEVDCSEDGSDRLERICLFCLESVVGSAEPGDGVIGVDKFFTFLGRHVGSQFDPKGMGDRQGDGGGGGVCRKCVQDLKPFCELYQEMERIRLKLEWALEQVISKMEVAPPPVQVTLEEGKDDFVTNIKAFRTDLIEKCNRKLRKSKPTISLERNLAPSPAAPSITGQLEDDSFGNDFLETGGDHFDSASEHSVELKYSPSPGGDLPGSNASSSSLDQPNNSKSSELRPSSSRRKPESKMNYQEVSGSDSDEEDDDEEEEDEMDTKKKPGGHRRKISSKKAPTTKKWSVCALCSKHIILIRGNVIRHLMRVHSLSLQDAKVKYLECQVKEDADLQKELLQNSAPPPPQFRLQFTCPLCSKRFSHKCNVINHLRKVHSMSLIEAKRAYGESDDPQVSKEGSGGALTSISKAVDKPSRKNIYCPVANCPQRFFLKDDLKHHKTLHGSFPCTSCDLVKGYAPDLSLHELEEHTPFKQEAAIPDADLTYRCARCDYTSLSKVKYISHHLESHLNLQLKPTSPCEICQAPLHKNGTSAAIHFQSHHDTSKIDPAEIKSCDLCPAHFLQSIQLHRHKRLFHGVDTANKCPECGKVFTYHQNLKHHLKTQHDDENPDLPFSCTVTPDCPKRFGSQDKLDWHRIHYRHTPKPKVIREVVICPECSRPCKGQDGLRIHLKSHKRSYVCEQCGLGFKKKNILVLHYLFHKSPEEWEYQCQECGKKCQTVYRLKEHMRIHTGEKYECRVCGKRYACRQKLRSHINTVHKEEGVQDIPRKKAKPAFVSKRVPNAK